MSRELAISIDGPTASGKTTLAEGLAAHIGAQVLDTGLTFRATAYAVLRERYVPDENFFGAVVRHEVGERGTPPGRPALVYQGVDITDDLWSTNVEASLPSISANPVWRRCIAVYHQSLLLSAERMIAVGRDCASSIMADATCHVYLTAAHSVRRERRRAQHRTQPRRAVIVNPATAVDHATRAYITERANGLILDTTFLPKAAVARAVLSQLGERR